VHGVREPLGNTGLPAGAQAVELCRRHVALLDDGAEEMKR
jgi:hypothetical protein